MDVEFAVLPVGHRRARLERLVARVGCDERLVEHERRVLEAGVEIAVRPLVGRLAHGQAPLLVFGEVGVGPLQLLDRRRRDRLPRHRWLRLAPDVAFEARVRAARTQGHQRIDGERKRFPIDLDLFDRFHSGGLVDSRDGEDRLALIDRLVAERLLALRVGGNALTEIGDDVGRRRQIVGGEDALDARHRQRLAGIEVPDAAVRERTQEQLAEEHAVGAVVFGVLRLAGDLGDEIGRRIVLADKFVRHITRSSCARRRASTR